jgi:cytochrome c-type biogenesis protein CcmH/NrfF
MAAEERRSLVRGGERFGVRFGDSNWPAEHGTMLATIVHVRERSAMGTVLFVMMMPLAAGTALRTVPEVRDEQKARILRIEDEVPAPCCYTEPVSRHQSEVALKMRLEIAKWVAAGKTDQEILNTYVSQYGKEVLVDPRTIPGWWMPWVPWIAVILAVVFGFWLLAHWRAKPVPAALPPLTPDTPILPDLDDEE